VTVITEVLGHGTTKVTEEIYLHAFDKNENETTLAAVGSVQERRLAAG
jgi:hypothetical protein